MQVGGFGGTVTVAAVPMQHAYPFSTSHATRTLLTLQRQSSTQYALARFLTLPPNSASDYIKDWLVPVFKDLPQVLKFESPNLTIADAPYDNFVAGVVRMFVKVVLGTKPGLQAKIWENSPSPLKVK